MVSQACLFTCSGLLINAQRTRPLAFGIIPEPRPGMMNSDVCDIGFRGRGNSHLTQSQVISTAWKMCWTEMENASRLKSGARKKGRQWE